MSFTKRISIVFRFRSLRTVPIIAGVILATLFLGCATLEKKPPPTMTGSFNGNSSDGRPASAKFVQDENAVVGTGSLNGRRFALSSVASWYGPAVLVFEDGSRTEVQIIMSPDGRMMTIRGLGEPLKLARTDYAAEPPTGPFAGVFADSGDPSIWLNLSQSGELLAGTGYVDGKPVAVTGSASSPEEARGVLLFSDGSKMGVRAVLSGDGETLTIKGLGRSIELQRR